MHNFTVSLMLLISILYVLVELSTMFAYYEILRALREMLRITPRKYPIVRDKFDAITFIQ